MRDLPQLALDDVVASLEIARRVPAPRERVADLEAALDALDPARPVPLADAVARVRRGLVTSARTSDARYLGMPHASPLAAAVVADLIASVDNPELATFEHATFAVLAERRAVALVAGRLGLAGADGGFTSGGAESNFAAIAVALAARFPAWRTGGVRALPRDPIVYASVEAHATITRAARLLGLGDDAVRRVAVDPDGRMVPDALADALGKDVAAGRAPLVVVATAGTTSTGAFDPLTEIADLADARGARLHVDAAWGGMLAFGARRPPALRGIERAHTVAFDPHKGLFAPLGTGMLFSRPDGALADAFSQRAPYLPRDDARDPRSQGLWWSRRFVGLRVLLPLATEGWDGLARRVDRMVALGDRLAAGLVGEGFALRCRSPLPLVAFTGPHDEQSTARWLTEAAADLLATTGARVVVGRSPSGARFLRAAIVSRHTSEEDVDAVVRALAVFAHRR